MAQRATSLSPKPSLVFLFVFFFAFLSLPLIGKNLFFYPKKGIFVYCSVSPFVSLSPFFGLPLFQSISSCLSLVFFFLPFCFSCLFLVLVFFLFASCFKRLFCFCFSACCFVLNHNLRCVFCFASCFLVVFLCLLFCYFWLPIKKTSPQRFRYGKKMKNAENNGQFYKSS